MKTESVLLVVILGVWGLSICAHADPWEGAGTAESPYLIYDANDMQSIGSDPNYWDAHFKLMADIDLSGCTGTEFNIIGNTATPFTGSFDGSGHTIADFSYSSSEGDNIGLFGYVNNPDTEIKNLGLIAPNIIFTGDGIQQWSRTYGSDSDSGFSVQATDDGGYIITGFTIFPISSGVAIDVYLLKTDVAGNKEWSRTFGGSNWDRGNSVQVTDDGGYIIVGKTNSFGAGGEDVYLIKTDAAGNEQWSRTFGGSLDDCGNSVQVTGDGGYIIAGHTRSFGGGVFNVYLIKTDVAGNEEWSQTFGGFSDDVGYSVQLTGDGGYIIAGKTHSFGAGSDDVYLIKTDLLGNAQWIRTFGGSTWDMGYSVQVTDDGGFIIAGETRSFGAGWSDVYLVKVDSAGNEQWSQTFGGGGWDYGKDIQITSDGGYIVVGYTSSFGAGGSDVYLIKTDAVGNEEWSRTFGGSSSDYGFSVHVTNDGDYIIAGMTYPLETDFSDLYLIKTYVAGQGALIGYFEDGILSDCMVQSGLITGTGAVGGLVGRIKGLVEDCYSTVAVNLTGINGSAGGLIGKNDGEINRCFTTGAVDSVDPDFAGGLVGSSIVGTVTASFWDTETSGEVSSAGGTGLTTAEMQMEDTYTSAGWDFVSVWSICENYNYPQLWWEDGICIDVTPIMLNFEAPLDGPDPNSQMLSISNCLGELPLDWEITVGGDCDWLDVYPLAGQAIGEIDEVELNVDVYGLDIGFYNCELTVSDDNAENSPQTVSVSLHVYIEGQRHVPSEYETIWDAVDAAVDGDEVILEPGTYSAGNGISTIGKPITIRSIDPYNPAIVAATIINQPGLRFGHGEDPDSVVEGITITPDSVGIGRGISCRDSSPTIRNCIIRDCFSESEGGGVLLENSNSLIENCIIKNNISYEQSGGIACMGGNPVIRNCLITNNSICGISSWGGNLTVENCTITDNLVPLRYEGTSGIVFGPSGDPVVKNSIIWNNHSGEGNEVVLGYYDWGYPPVAAISFCDIDGGQSGVYIDPCSTLNWGDGNIDIDPCFAEPGLVGPGLDLASYWMFDEGEGTIAHDSADNNYGTVYGAQWTTGKIEGALEFDGVDDYVTVGKDDYDFPNNVLTWSVWINPSSYASNRVILWDDDRQSGGDRGIELRNDGRVGAGEWFVDTISSSVISLGEWHHIVFTSGDGEMKLYIDGELNATSPGLLPDHTGRSFVSIGSGHDGYRGYFHGVIDEVAIYNRAISFQEVQDIYENGLNGHGLLVNLPGDYHLKPSSPCIDAGDPNYPEDPNETDIDGQARIVGGRIDMGADEVQLQVVLELDVLWMYQNVLTSTNSKLTADVSIADDPWNNSSYTYDWEIILPDDVSIAPAITAGGGSSDPCYTFAAPSCNEPGGLSDSGETFTVRVTVTGADFGNTGIAEAEFGIALLGDANNDGVVNIADRAITNAFWRLGAAGPFTFIDCDINSDEAVNVADRAIANAVWRGVLGENRVSEPCPLR